MRTFSSILLAILLFPVVASATHSDGCKKKCKDVSAPIVFFDIAGEDTDRLQTFYAGIFNWKFDEKNNIDKASTGGLSGSLRKDPPGKIIYIGVPDVEATLQQIVASGGTIIAPRFEVKGVVVLGLFRDPAGNNMGLVETVDGKIKIP